MECRDKPAWEKWEKWDGSRVGSPPLRLCAFERDNLPRHQEAEAQGVFKYQDLPEGKYRVRTSRMSKDGEGRTASPPGSI